MLVAKYAEIESHAASIALDMELQKQEELQGVDSKERALSMAEQLIGTMVQSKMSPSNIKDLVINNPTIIDKLLESDEIVNLVTEKVISSKK